MNTLNDFTTITDIANVKNRTQIQRSEFQNAESFALHSILARSELYYVLACIDS